MKGGVRRFGAADRRLLPEGRLAGPMPWVIAIMMFLTVLAAAAGLGLGSAAASLNAAVGDRVTDPDPRAQSGRARGRCRRGRRPCSSSLPGVKKVRRLSPSEINRLLEPWLGAGGADADLPIPAMIDADLGPGGDARLDEVRSAVARPSPRPGSTATATGSAPLGRADLGPEMARRRPGADDDRGHLGHRRPRRPRRARHPSRDDRGAPSDGRDRRPGRAAVPAPDRARRPVRRRPRPRRGVAGAGADRQRGSPPSART